MLGDIEIPVADYIELRKDLFPSNPDAFFKKDWENFLFTYKTDTKLFYTLKTPYKGDFFMFKKKGLNNSDIVLGAFHFNEFASLSTYLGIPLPNTLIFEIKDLSPNFIIENILQKTGKFEQVEKSSKKYYSKGIGVYDVDELEDSWLNKKEYKKTIKLGWNTGIYVFNKDKKIGDVFRFSFVYIPYKYSKYRTPHNLNIEGNFYWFDNYNLFEYLDSKGLMLNWIGINEKSSDPSFNPKIVVWRETDKIKNTIAINNDEVKLYNAIAEEFNTPDNKFEFSNSLQFPFFHLPHNMNISVFGDSDNWVVSEENSPAVSPFNQIRSKTLNLKLAKTSGKNSDNTTWVNLTLIAQKIQPKFEIKVINPENLHAFFITNKNNYKFRVLALSNKTSYKVLDSYYKCFNEYHNWINQGENKVKLQLYLKIKKFLDFLKNKSEIEILGRNYRETQKLRNELIQKLGLKDSKSEIRKFETQYKTVTDKWNLAYQELEKKFDAKLINSIKDKDCPEDVIDFFSNLFDALDTHPEGIKLLSISFGNFIKFSGYSGIIKQRPVISFSEIKSSWKFYKKSHKAIFFFLTKKALENAMSDISIIRTIYLADVMPNGVSKINEIFHRLQEGLSNRFLSLEHEIPKIKVSKPVRMYIGMRKFDIQYIDSLYYDTEFVKKTHLKDVEVDQFKFVNALFHSTLSLIYSYRFYKDPSFENGVDFLKNSATSAAEIIRELEDFLPSGLQNSRLALTRFGGLLSLYSANKSIQSIEKTLSNNDNLASTLHGVSAFTATLEAFLPLVIEGGSINPYFGLGIALIGISSAFLADYYTDSEIANDIEAVFFGVEYGNLNESNIRKTWDNRINFQIAILNKYFVPITRHGALEYLRHVNGQDKITFVLDENSFQKGALIIFEFFYRENIEHTIERVTTRTQGSTFNGYFGFYLFPIDSSRVTITFINSNHKNTAEIGNVKINYSEVFENYVISFSKTKTNLFKSEEVLVNEKIRKSVDSKIEYFNLLVTHEPMSKNQKPITLKEFENMYTENYKATAISIKG